MEKNRSGIGTVAAIMYILLLLHSVVQEVIWLSVVPAQHWEFSVLDFADLAIGWGAQILLIVTLFKNKRSQMLLVKYGIDFWLMAFHMLRGWANEHFRITASLLSLSVGGLLVNLAYFLTAAMVVYICIPSLRPSAGWTGKIWFLPTVIQAVLRIYNLIDFWGNYHEMNAFVPNFITDMLVSVLIVVSMLLFCLWLTEPVRNREMPA